MPASPLIRPATPADIPAILALMQGLAEYEKLTHLFAATEANLHTSLFGEHPAAHCLVAENETGTGLVAYALWFQNYSTFLAKPGLYLEDLYVDPEQRGKGIGKALLLRLAAIALERGYGRFEWTVLDWNQPAIDFYEGMGAQVLPEWRIVRVTGDALVEMGRKGANHGA
ncbi:MULTISPECIES: GNAT family N-acetyltransferase [unclassified Achromobacter]|uniref:GNAT family N-acetyltransferase n=1 Tax=unclassified Achromobacter TaxID=2626865 RepID=UPI000B51C328|nr:MULTISPECIES: GNAT family N-acetyltransferase [unclassified Achromobacter]OWT74922.1 GNAT family N-acetyltransferase [Achromobacter sp. HZ28]OWT76530.1 GNAT family N-acetyltransferase [Achromobacter sp. HZ34]